MRYRITLSYLGSSFCGWQIQNNAVTVQGEIEKALSILLGESISITGAGRTDTGVNAIGYVAHFDSQREIITEDEIALSPKTARKAAPIEASHFLYKINAIVGKGIVIHDIKSCGEDFHARFSATRRTYNYLVHRDKDPFIDNLSYWFPYELDIEKMNRAAEYMIGEKDFSSFEKVGGANTTSICTVYEARWESYTPQHILMSGASFSEDSYLRFTVSANRFLRNMVRAMAGSLLEVGRGRKEPEWIIGLIESRNRCNAGQSVPGKALFFTGVEYQ